jgi:predicted HAD superfamily phosphohydrolase
MYAFAKEIHEMETGSELRKLTRGVDKKELFRRIDEIFARVPDGEVPEWDRPDRAQ